ncbi:hypothetical protein J7E50_02950 [Pedobacter sp. ISL-68]|uniref:hypothetical protein n=1 Tax=unclassified Pedobacter TaxID=2628915 RepID=UPI001BE85CAD|nr:MULTISPECIES: hypothetical protein [unclassified Pedobacter]MBT2560179.1 hypothetical protein [Pedobacter sp. ISL-64]MBT2589158.1 hypothetical protein [Pedobacter sp. ISL-68]
MKRNNRRSLQARLAVLPHIVKELQRIDKAVPLNEQAGIKTLALDRDNDPVLVPMDDHQPQKKLGHSLEQFPHKNLISLLKFLRSTVGKDGKTGSVFTRLKPKEMGYHEYLDYWLCACGNFEKLEGFNACDSEGNLVSPVPKASFCRCERCGRVIKVSSHTIVGINLNPIRGRF